jgi:hypothetical protein
LQSGIQATKEAVLLDLLAGKMDEHREGAEAKSSGWEEQGEAVAGRHSASWFTKDNTMTWACMIQIQ